MLWAFWMYGPHPPPRDGTRLVWGSSRVASSPGVCSYGSPPAALLRTRALPWPDSAGNTCLRQSLETCGNLTSVCFWEYHFVQLETAGTTKVLTIQYLFCKIQNHWHYLYQYFQKQRSYFFNSLIFLSLEYKLSTEQKLRKWYKLKSSIRIWSKQFQIIRIRSVCYPSIFPFALLKLCDSSELELGQSS